MKKIALPLIAGLLACPSLLEAQSKLAPNTLHFLQTEQHLTSRGVQTTPQRVNAYLSVREDIDLEQLARLGVQVNLNLGDLLTAQIPVKKIEEVAQLEGIRYLQLAITPQPMLDQARAVTGVDKIHAGTGLQGAFMGKDVVVGIIDAGFDYQHPNFYTADGKTLRIQRVWEQGNTRGTHPEGFTYGAEYKTPEDIAKALYDINTNSHGTHVAGIAAGGYRGNNWYGVAGDADIVLVSKGELTPDNVNISDAIAYIYQYAESVGKPCVINMSLGMEIGPHDGTSIFDQVSDRLQGPGKLLVGSVGNFHGAPLHVSKQFTGADDSPLQTMVDYKIKPYAKNFGGEIDIWGEAGMKYDVQVVMNYYSRNDIVCASEVMDASKAEGGSQTFKITKNGSGKVLITTEINPFNQKPHTYISLQVENVRSRNAIGIIVTPKSAGDVHIWSDNIYTNLTDNGCEGWTKGNGDYTLVEIGGTGKNIVSVGAYTTRNTYTRMGSTQEEKLDETVGEIASFSSRGPALDGRMKPEISAPGTFIISSVNSHDGTLSSTTPLAGGIDGTNYCYGYMQGTSMAAPFVTGTVATWLQANPQLTPDEVRDILKQTAVKDKFTGNEPSPGVWGYGKLDAYEGLKTALAMTGIQPLTTAENWISILQNQLLFAQPLHQVEVKVYDAAGKLCQHIALGEVRPGEEYALPVAALPSGIYLVKVSHSQGAQGFKIMK